MPGILMLYWNEIFIEKNEKEETLNFGDCKNGDQRKSLFCKRI